MFRPKGGRPRSKFGAFLDAHGVNQNDIERETGLSRNTVSKAANDGIPTKSVQKTLINAIKKLTHKDVNEQDFWA